MARRRIEQELLAMCEAGRWPVEPPKTFAKMVKLYNACGANPAAICSAAITLDDAAKAGKGSGVGPLSRLPKPLGQR